jgi:tRNA 2-thiouridine synthesizing protein A
MTEVDARGLSCPMPVIKTKNAIESSESGPIVVIVNDGTARNNVTRLAKSKGFNITVEEKGEDLYLTLTKDDK